MSLKQVAIVKTKVEAEVVKQIVQALETLTYGEVLIKVHNCKVVFFEKKEKKTFK